MLGGDLRCEYAGRRNDHPLETLSLIPDRSGFSPLGAVWDIYPKKRFSSTLQSYPLPSRICTRNVLSTGARTTPCYFRSISAYPLRMSSNQNRDIKPDNILLDEQGHAHLTDFNIAVHYSERKMLTGVAGSMAYMAPEILVKKGYSYTIDWWSLGVCVYELIFGRRPFRGRTNGDLTHSITKDPLRFPEDAEMKCSKRGMQALASFLERDVTKRLGCKTRRGRYPGYSRPPLVFFARLGQVREQTVNATIHP
jgi:serine/threonine protein kinase